MNVSPPFALSVLKVVVLQQAFTSLVTDRTVNWVIDEQCLLNTGTTFLNSLTVGNNDSSVFGWCLAPWNKFWNH
jgi:hypothetical protein